MPGEESPLLQKASGYSSLYSHRTAETVSTSSSNDHLDQLEKQQSFVSAPTVQNNEAPQGADKFDRGFLGSIVAFETPFSDDAQESASALAKGDNEVQGEEMDGNFVDDVIDEVRQVAESVLEELNVAEEDDIGFLEMGLTRNLSILPEDLMDAAGCPRHPAPVPSDEEEATEHEVGLEAQPPPPWSAYLLLLSAVVSLSAIGPFLELQGGTSQIMKVTWRTMGTSIMLLPLAISEVREKGFPKLTIPQCTTFLFSAVCYDVCCLSFALALDFTSVGNAVILGNSIALIMLVGKLLAGQHVTLLEGCGAVVAFGGAALCSKDSAETLGGANSLFGDALALLSAFGGVGYLIFAKTARQHIPMAIFMCMIMGVGSFLVFMFQVLVLGELVTFDMNRSHGLFGFLSMDMDRFPLEIGIVVVCNCFGAMGYVRAMQYFDNLVISSAALLEPVVAVFMAYIFGVGSLPGVQGWLGNLLVALGTLAVLYKERGGSSVH